MLVAKLGGGKPALDHGHEGLSILVLEGELELGLEG
jgi:hypothetical protein